MRNRNNGGTVSLRAVRASLAFGISLLLALLALPAKATEGIVFVGDGKLIALELENFTEEDLSDGAPFTDPANPVTVGNEVWFDAVSASRRGVWSYNVTNGVFTQHTSDPFGSSNDLLPHPSPDAQQFLYSTNRRGSYRYNVSLDREQGGGFGDIGASGFPLTDAARKVTWAKSDAALIFSGKTGTSTQFYQHTISGQSAAEVGIDWDPANSATALAVTRIDEFGGKLLASTPSGGIYLRTVSPTPSLAQLLASGNDAAFNSDGTKIVFVDTDGGGSVNLFTAGADGSNVQQITLNARVESHPAWVDFPVFPEPALSAQQTADLNRWIQGCYDSLVNPASYNTTASFARGFYARNAPKWRYYDSAGVEHVVNDVADRGIGNHANLNESTLRLVAIAAAGKMGLPGTGSAWDQVKKGLETLEFMQTSGIEGQFDEGRFFRFYDSVHGVGKGFQDRLPEEILATSTLRGDPIQLTSDDNGLGFCNLLVLEGLIANSALDAGDKTTLSQLCRRIRDRQDLSTFILPANGGITHQLTKANGIYEADLNRWDFRGAEGPAIAAAALLSGSVDLTEFLDLLDTMETRPIIWNNPAGSLPATFDIAQSTYHAAAFLLLARGPLAFPITPEGHPGARFWDDTFSPTMRAHYLFAKKHGLTALGSQVMTQNLEGYSLLSHRAPNNDIIQVQFPGNYDNDLPDPNPGNGVGSISRATTPHAIAAPLARFWKLDQAMVDDLITWLNAYEAAGFFNSNDGFLAAIPWTPGDTTFTWDGAYTDNGNPNECLTACYIILSLYDALNPDQTLADLNPELGRLGAIAAYLDSDTPIPSNLFDPPGIPDGLVATMDNSNMVALSWNAVSGAERYHIWRSLTDDIDTAERIGIVEATTFDDKTAQPDTTWYYFVRATNSGTGPGSSSGSASGVRPKAPAATTPVDTWSAYYSLAIANYEYYAFVGLWDYAAAIYYYYYGIGDYYYYLAFGNRALADYSYYNASALYYLYLYGVAGYSSYYYYLAFAYYYYFVGIGDFGSANLYYNAFIAAAYGI